MSVNEAEVRFGADVGELTEGMARAKEAVSSSLEGMASALEGVLGKYQEVLAVLAGGAIFKEAISAFMEMGAEAGKLMNALGVDAREAAGLSQALEEVGSSGDAYTAAFMRFTRAAKQHSEQLQAMGVDVAAFRAGQITTQELMQQSLQAVMQYKAGFDRTQASMLLFGRNVGDLTKLMKVNQAAIEEAAKDAETLGLVYTEADMKMKSAFTKMKANAGDAFSGIEKVMAEAVLPRLTEMGTAFSALGPTLVEIARIAMTGVKAAFDGVGLAFDAVAKAVKDAFGGFGKLFGLISGSLTPMQLFQNVVAVLGSTFIALGTAVGVTYSFVKTFATEVVAAFVGLFQEIQGIATGIYHVLVGIGYAFADALTGDFTRSKSYFAKAWDDVKSPAAKAAADIKGIWNDGMSDIEKRSEASRKKIDALLMGDAFKKSTSPVATPSGGSKTYTPPGQPGDEVGASKVVKAQLEAKLALLKEYDREEMLILDDQHKRNLISEEEYWSEKEAIQRNEMAKEIELKRTEMDSLAAQMEEVKGKKGATDDAQAESKRNALMAQRVALQGQIDVLVAKETDLHAEMTRQMEEANRKRAEAIAQVSTQHAQDVGHDRVAEEQAQNEQLKALRIISDAEAIARKRKFADAMYAIDLQAARDHLKIANDSGDPAKIAEANARIESLERSHQKSLNDIDREAALERNKYNLQFMDSLESAFTSLFESLAKGQKTLKAVLLDFVGSVSSAISHIYAEMLAKQIVGGLGSASSGGSGLGGVFSGLASLLPHFDVGTPYVPQDMMAVVHKGEAIVPATQNKPGMAATNIVMNISTPNASSFMQSQAQILAQLNAGLAAARRNM